MLDAHAQNTDKKIQMANLKIFVSSTCYDMHSIRTQLRSLLLTLGHEPVMSDQADVLYDPRSHTHTSCLREVENCDAVVVVIGSRFGGSTVPKALELLDLTRVKEWSRSENFADDKGRISITQAEVIRAIQSGIPVFAFVDAGVMRDHLTYEKNKGKTIINEIEFSSIDKRDTAQYIFEFINFLRLRNENNSILDFSRFEDIELQLKKQWSALFQRLLHEQRERSAEARRIDNLSSQIADLKAAVLGSISSKALKETAKGAIRYRGMIDLVSGLAGAHDGLDVSELLRSQHEWSRVLEIIHVREIRSEPGSRFSTIMIRTDGTYYRIRASLALVKKMITDWDAFQKLNNDAKDAIISAVLDSNQSRPNLFVTNHKDQFVDPAERPDSDEDYDDDDI